MFSPFFSLQSPVTFPGSIFLVIIDPVPLSPILRLLLSDPQVVGSDELRRVRVPGVEALHGAGHIGSRVVLELCDFYLSFVGGPVGGSFSLLRW